MLRSLLASICLLGVSAASACALASDNPTTPATRDAVHPHAAAMAELQPLLGAFVLSGTQNEVDGSVTTLLPGRAEGVNVLGRTGLRLSTRVGADGAEPVATELTMGYDQYRDLYRIAVLDDQSGLLDIYEGTIEDGVLSTTNLRTDTFYMAGDTKVHFRLVWDLNDSVIGYTVDASVDGGQTWLPYMMMEMTPVA